MSTQGWVTRKIAPPMNGQVISPYQRGVLDLRWDNPAILASNAEHQVVGVNVYRADTSDRGPYHRLTTYPLGGGFYRDQTEVIPVRETISWDTGWASRGPNWTLRLRFPPVMPPVQNEPARVTTRVQDLKVLLNGVVIPLSSVAGLRQEVTLGLAPYVDPVIERRVSHEITEDTVVEVHYWRVSNVVRGGLQPRIFYRLTTVILEDGAYRESALSDSPPLSLMSNEPIEYYWREGIRKSQWILEQGGEPVKLFVRKEAGIPCYCGQDPEIRGHTRQPHGRCKVCFGTGFLGGYEGPFDVIVAPDNAERRTPQGPNGRRVEHTYEVWLGPNPVVSQRDFIVKQTNERYSVGPVTRHYARGTALQQHFTLGLLDTQDIRQYVPVDGVALEDLLLKRTPLRPSPAPLPTDGSPEIVAERDLPESELWPVGPSKVTPMVTDKASVPAETQVRGRTPAWERTNV